jgi:hypothetical protein
LNRLRLSVLKRAEDVTKGRLASAVLREQESVASKLHVASGSAVTELPYVPDMDDLLDHAS